MRDMVVVYSESDIAEFAKGADKDPPDPESQAALDKFEADLAACNTTS